MILSETIICPVDNHASLTEIKRHITNAVDMEVVIDPQFHQRFLIRAEYRLRNVPCRVLFPKRIVSTKAVLEFMESNSLRSATFHEYLYFIMHRPETAPLILPHSQYLDLGTPAFFEHEGSMRIQLCYEHNTWAADSNFLVVEE